MPRPILFAAFTMALVLLLPAAARAQGPSWSPPSRDMPAMPRQAELRGDWLGPRAAWFSGVEAIAGAAPSALRAMGEMRPGSDVAQMVRFTNGALPAVVWSDRNGDGRSDMIEIFRSGGVIIQLVDADFDGAANVLRVYDSGGKLLRQDRM